MHNGSCIDWQHAVIAQGANRLDVVGMIVRDEHMMNLRQTESIVPESFPQGPDAHANINDKPIMFSV
jgi:hypothetical protein